MFRPQPDGGRVRTNRRRTGRRPTIASPVSRAIDRPSRYPHKMVRFTVLASGSKGNSTVVTGGRTRILVDAGLSCRELFRRMKLAEEDPATLDAIIVTHEHSDHVGGLAVTARKLGIPVYFTEATHRAWMRWLTPRRQMTYAQWLEQVRKQAAERQAESESAQFDGASETDGAGETDELDQEDCALPAESSSVESRTKPAVQPQQTPPTVSLRAHRLAKTNQPGYPLSNTSRPASPSRSATSP